MSCTHRLAIARGQSSCGLCGASIEPPLEVVPAGVTKRAEAMEQGKTIIGGRQYGKTWAARIATARPVNQSLTETTP